MRNWNFRSLYLYAVCFATLMMSIVATVNLINTGVELAYPSPSWGPTQAEMILREQSRWVHEGAGRELTAEEIRLIEEQVREQEERSIASQRHSNARRLGQSSAMLVVAVPIYLYHWGQVQKREKDED